MKEALSIHVDGIVQGVGFRPFVYKLAKRYLINGWVLNAVDGVTIHAEGESKHLDEFVLELSENPPAAAQVERITLDEVPLEDFDDFTIRFSNEGATDKTTRVSPDLATCDDCVRELFDVNDRRYRYPFLNCTNCGPRFTIIEKLPYDRDHTSMKMFPMCTACNDEYTDPLNRRFHAQPNACFECGPHLRFQKLNNKSVAEDVIEWGSTRELSDELLQRTIDIIRSGEIVAIKGLGGFHLVCDATNDKALGNLRTRKHRDGKPFAVMVADVQAARRYCEVSAEEEKVLTSPARPIVLLKKRKDVTFASGLADDLEELGVMLPATPVQHLLISDYEELCGPSILVMTSGNIHDAPIEIDDNHAAEVLSSIAVALLGNNREIRSRYDDSVVRVLNLGYKDELGEDATAVQFLRRARGFAPLPVPMALKPEEMQAKESFEARIAEQKKQGVPQLCPKIYGDTDSLDSSSIALLATGPEQKVTFTLLRDEDAFVSQHIGDLEDARIFDAWLALSRHYQDLFSCKPQMLATDMHPEYLSAKWAREQDLPRVEVQHHHAHIASVLGEHGLFGPVCGIAFDGTGYGLDGAIWGGEVLIANRAEYERFANFSYVPMPGGSAAVKHPLRMAYGFLWAFDLLDHPGASHLLKQLGEDANVYSQMIDKGINSPLTSSVGRMFDAVSALLGICVDPTYEGEAAVALDAARSNEEVDEETQARYKMGILKNAATATSTAFDTSVVLIDAASTFNAILDDIEDGVNVHSISLRFHNAVAQAIENIVLLVEAAYGIRTVALSGGVFMNRYIVEQTTKRLHEAGFTVAINANQPPNDGCISFGQAVVASQVVSKEDNK